MHGGEQAGSVTGPAAGEGEGRSASAPAKRGVREMVHCQPINRPWHLRVETGRPDQTIAPDAALWEGVQSLWWLGVEVVDDVPRLQWGGAA